jgi:hypothetical protein
VSTFKRGDRGALMTLLVTQRDRVRWVPVERWGSIVDAPDRVEMEGAAYVRRGRVESASGPRWVYERVGCAA